jgi:hypothetical protein
MRFSFTDGYADRPSDRRGELQERIRSLKMHLWADPADKHEPEGLIEQAELRELGRGNR